MAAPVAGPRLTPELFPMRDGFTTLIALQNDPNIGFWEKSVTPPGLNRGDKIDTTTMHNDEYMTSFPQSLTEVTDSTATVAYNSFVAVQIIAQIGDNQTITLHFPDGGEWAIWGALNGFQPGEHTKGEQPTAEVTFVFTNIDNSCGEFGPTYTLGGTCPGTLSGINIGTVAGD